MKKASKLLWVLLALGLATVMLAGCPGTGTENEGDGDTVTVKGSGDWSIAPGDSNGVGADLLKIEGAKEENNGVLKVTWSSDTDWKMCELYAMLPADTDYGAYDGIFFKVKLPVNSNFLFLLRNPDGGTTWKVAEDYVYKGSADSELVWVEVKRPFSAAVDSGWGPAPAQDTLKGWLTADKATQKQINLNPVLNPGGENPGVANTDYVTYFDDIGFYKGSDPENPDSTEVIWSFDIEE